MLPTDDPEPEPAVPGRDPTTDSEGGEGARSWKNGRVSSFRGSSRDMRPNADEKDEPAPVPLSWLSGIPAVEETDEAVDGGGLESGEFD